MDTRKRLISYLQKQGYSEAQAEERLKYLRPPFQQRGKYGSTLSKKYRWMEDYPLLENLYELKKQGKIKQERILPQWVEKQVKEIRKMGRSQSSSSKEWRDLVWDAYWFVDTACDERVALAVAKIRAKWHTGDSPETFFARLREQEEEAIRAFIKAGYPEEEIRDPLSALRKMAGFVGCFDDRDTTLDSKDEHEGYGLPEEDFDKDRKQLAFLLGGATGDRNLTWIGLTIPFIWPNRNTGFTRVPRNAIRVNGSAAGVTITLTSRFVTHEELTSPLLWSRVKNAIKGKWGVYEEVLSVKEMIKYLKKKGDINKTTSKVYDIYDEEHWAILDKMPKQERDRVKNRVVSAHKMRQSRAKHRPMFSEGNTEK